MFDEFDYDKLNKELARVNEERLNRPSDRELLLRKKPPRRLMIDDGGTDWFYLGGHVLPISEVKGSIFGIGISRSGKTLQIKPSIATAIAGLRDFNCDRRVIIADPKQDLLPFVDRLCKQFNAPLHYFNLSDSRSVALDFARDLDGRSDKFREAVKILLPAPEHGEAFWAQVAQSIAHAGMLVLQKKKGFSWGLHDLYRFSLRDIPGLIQFLSNHPQGKAVAARYFPEKVADNTKFGFVAELSASISQLELAATAQHYTPRENWISLDDLTKQRGVFLFGTNSDTRKSVNPVVQLMFRTLVNKINLMEDSTTRKTFIFFDELPFWGKLDGLAELLTFSPSKGAVTYLVCQDIQHLKEIYGDNIAEVISGMCQSKVIFAPASEMSAEWSVKTLGKHRFRESSFTWQTNSYSETERWVTDYPITTGELRQMGLANRHRGSTFILSSPWNTPYMATMTADDIDYWQPQNGDIPLSVPRPREQYVFPLGTLAATEEDIETVLEELVAEFKKQFGGGNPMHQKVAESLARAMGEYYAGVGRQLFKKRA